VIHAPRAGVVVTLPLWRSAAIGRSISRRSTPSRPPRQDAGLRSSVRGGGGDRWSRMWSRRTSVSCT